MIRIINKGAPSKTDSKNPMGNRNYHIYINDEFITSFTHKKSEGLALMLYYAYLAVVEKEKNEWIKELNHHKRI